MAKAVDIRQALASLPVLRGRRPETRGPEADAAFAVLAETENVGVFAGSFDGESAWERHPNGDELVHILDGEARLTILSDGAPGDAPGGAPTVLHLKAGMLTLVPQGRWQKFHAPTGVTVLTMTPQPTDLSTAEDPTEGGGAG